MNPLQKVGPLQHNPEIDLSVNKHQDCTLSAAYARHLIVIQMYDTWLCTTRDRDTKVRHLIMHDT